MVGSGLLIYDIPHTPYKYYLLNICIILFCTFTHSYWSINIDEITISNDSNFNLASNMLQIKKNHNRERPSFI